MSRLKKNSPLGRIFSPPPPLHAREQYRQRRSGWFVGQSPPGVPCVTPVEARAHLLKLVTQHKLDGICEFLKDVHPRMGRQWTQSREQLGGRGMQPAPWMWMEDPVMLHNKVFVDDTFALFVHRGVTSQKRGASGYCIPDHPPSGLLRSPSGRRPCPTSMKAGVSRGRISYPSFPFTMSRRSFACVPRTPPLIFVTAFCYGSLLRSPVPLWYSSKYVGVRAYKYGRVR